MRQVGDHKVQNPEEVLQSQTEVDMGRKQQTNKKRKRNKEGQRRELGGDGGRAGGRSQYSSI